MVAKVRRVANPRRKPVRAKARKRNPSSKTKSGSRKKLSAKQIKFFGTKRQKAALKAKRRKTGTVKAKSNPVRRKRTHKPRSKRKMVRRSNPVVVVVKKAMAKRRKSPKKRNPIQAVTLGFLNPHKGRKVMAKKRKRHAKASPVRRARRKSNPSVRRRRATRSVMVVRRNSRKKYGMRRNPSFFGSSVSTVEMVKYIGGGLAGVAIAKAAVPMLPEALRGSQAMVVASTIGVAFIAGWAASKIDPKIGSAVLFGGLMQGASVFLNSFVPTVGRIVALQGGRGVGEFVPARFPVPQNPILANGAGGGAAVAGRAYQPAY